MDHADREARENLDKELPERVDLFDVVVDNEDLAAPVQLFLDSLFDKIGGEFVHIGGDGHPAGGRRLDETHVFDSRECHVQSPGDGGRAHGEDVDLLLPLENLLLLFHAEALFFVDDQKAEVLEENLVGEEGVGSDQDVQSAFAEPLQDVRLLLGRGRPAQRGDLDGEGGEAAGEGLHVLVDEDGGRAEDHGLLVVDNGPEDGPHGHLGLSETDVPTEKPVHRLIGRHVQGDLFPGGRLIFRGLVLEGPYELLFPIVAVGKSDTGGGHPLGVEVQKVFGDLEDSGLDSLVGPFPVLAPQLVQRGPVISAPGVAVDSVQGVYGDIDLVASGVADDDVVVDRPGGGHPLNPEELSDPITGVDHQVPLFQILKLCQEGLQLALFLLLRRLRGEEERGRHESEASRGVSKPRRDSSREDAGSPIQPLFPEVLFQEMAPLLGVGKEEILLSLLGHTLPEGGRSDGEGEVPEGGGCFPRTQVEEGESGFRREESEELVRQEPLSRGGLLFPPLPELSEALADPLDGLPGDQEILGQRRALLGEKEPEKFLPREGTVLPPAQIQFFPPTGETLRRAAPLDQVENLHPLVRQKVLCQ